MTVGSLFGRHKDGRTLVLNHYDEKFRRLRLASVATDNVNVIRTFIESLTRVQGDRLLPLDLHDGGAVRQMNECVGVVAMDWLYCARWILHDQQRALLTGDVGQVTRNQRRHLRGFLSGGRGREAKKERARKQKTMHGANP